jgi:hypothetical protein
MRTPMSTLRKEEESSPALIPVEPRVAVALPVPCGGQAHGCSLTEYEITP